MAQLLQRLGYFAVRRRRSTLAAWLLGLVVIGVLAATFRGAFADEFKVPGTESQQAIELIQKAAPGANADGATGRVVFAGDAIDERKVGAASKALSTVPGVASASEPVVSKDGTVAYTDLQFSIPQAEVAATQTDAIEAATHDAAPRVEYAGSAAAVESEAPIGEVLGVLVAMLVLAVTFGSMLAAGLPLLTALVGVGVGMLGIQFASGFTNLTSTSVTLAAMLGLAVGIDYALFILSRHRTQVRDGMKIEDSIALAVGTAGSAVVFAGFTVMIALVALVMTGTPFWRRWASRRRARSRSPCSRA
jgi:putative drug exporter of the RND superfamily